MSFKKVLALLLVFCLCISVFPVAAFATDTDEQGVEIIEDESSDVVPDAPAAAESSAEETEDPPVEETDDETTQTRDGYVASNGDTQYETLEAAFAAATDGDTITLLANASGNGIVVPEGKFNTAGLTVNFNGHTYDVTGDLVGSTGTESQGFQLLRNNKVTFTNGTVTSNKALFLIQNYSDLTLDQMVLTLANAGYAYGYTLSNNNGNVVINNTTINANTGGGVAFDVCRYATYPSVYVTVEGRSVINGNVEVSASDGNAMDGFTLAINSAALNGRIIIDPSAETAMMTAPEKAIITKTESLEIVAPSGYAWTAAGDGKQVLAVAYSAQIGETQYRTLKEAVEAVPANGTPTTITMINDESVYVTGYAITISNNQNVVLDLNGHHISGTNEQKTTSALIRNVGTLTIEDSSTTKTGEMSFNATQPWIYSEADPSGYASNLIRNEGTLLVNGGTLINNGSGSATYAIDNYTTGKVTVNDGTVDAAKTAAIRMFYINGGELNVAGGTIGHYNSESDQSYYGIQVMAGTNADVNITGGDRKSNV